MRQILHGYDPVINNRYRVIEPLGSGGMAIVYRARDKLLDRDVALKVLRHHFADDEEFVERFKREAKIAAALSHPNIASVHDLGKTQNGNYYMAMEYVPGGTLRDRIRKGPLSPIEAAAIAIQVAQALKTAHALGTIHRDIKPQNIILTKAGVVKVADFGIARAAALSEITREGLVLGTEHYMSPEQAKGAPVGPRSDLYSLGVVLYEMLTGKLPHEADGPLLGSTTLPKRLSSHPRPPKEINPFVPERLSTTTVRLLSKDPERRYRDASSLIADLEKARGEPLGRATTRVLTLAFQKGRSLGSVTTRVLNLAARQARTAYKSRTRKTKPYIPLAPIPRGRIGRCKPAKKQRQKILPRFVLIMLTLAAVLVLLHLDPGAGARLWAEVERKIEDSLGEIQHTLNKEIENGLAAMQNKLVDGINGFIMPTPEAQQDSQNHSNSSNDPGESTPQGSFDLPSKKGSDKNPGGSLFPAQNDLFSQTPSGSYNPPHGGPSYPSNGSVGSSSPGIYTPSPYSPSDNSNGSFFPDTYIPDPNSPCNCNGMLRHDSYQQSRKEVEKQIEDNLANIQRMFGQ
jgi:serine/threonine protein kinase